MKTEILIYLLPTSGYSQEIGSAYQRKNKGRRSEFGVSPLLSTASWTSRLSDRSLPQDNFRSGSTGSEV